MGWWLETMGRIGSGVAASKELDEGEEGAVGIWGGGAAGLGIGWLDEGEEGGVEIWGGVVAGLGKGQEVEVDDKGGT